MKVLARERASFFAFNVLLEMVIEPKIMYRSMTSDVNGGLSRVVKKAEERYRGFDIRPKQDTQFFLQGTKYFYCNGYT